MKYVKLFENWLNEAEGKIKPFDPKKPGDTLVFDISAWDVNAYKIESAYQSIFNRLLAKTDSPDVEQKVIVTQYNLYLDSDNTAKNVYLTNLNDLSKSFTAGEYAILDQTEVPDPVINNEFVPYAVRGKDVKIPSKKSKYKLAGYNVPPSECFFVIFPVKWPNTSDKKTPFFTEDSSFYVWGGGDKVELVSLSKIVNGFLNFEEKGKMVFDKSIDLKQLAEVLGYEIPDNYTPKKGGAKKIEK